MAAQVPEFTNPSMAEKPGKRSIVACRAATKAELDWPSRRSIPEVLYAIVEAADDKSGFYRSCKPG